MKNPIEDIADRDTYYDNENVGDCPAAPCSMPADWNLFLSNLGDDAGEPRGFWRLKDAITEAEFALGAGLVNTAVITRASNSVLSDTPGVPYQGDPGNGSTDSQ